MIAVGRNRSNGPNGLSGSDAGLHTSCAKTSRKAARSCGKPVDLGVGRLARAEHRQPFPQRRAETNLRRRFRGRCRRLFSYFDWFLLDATPVAHVPEVDVEPLDLVAQQQDGAAGRAHLFALVERQSFPPTPQQRELFFVQAIRGRVLAPEINAPRRDLLSLGLQSQRDSSISFGFERRR
jgi:hypothetical protein